MRKIPFAVLCSLFIFCAKYAAYGRTEFDAEDVIDRPPPYKRTAERSSAAKKPHKSEETRRFFRRVSTFYSVLGI